MNKEDVVYVAIMLDESSISMCKALVEHYAKIPNEKWTLSQFTIGCEHITLGFGDKVTNEMIKCVGMEVKDIHPKAMLIDDYGCYGLFISNKELSSRGIPFTGTHVHVTLCHPNIIAPVAVGTIPDRDHYCVKINPAYSLTGKIMAFCKNGDFCC